MLTLLAESKTMSGDQRDIDLGLFDLHKPVFEDTADEIMANLAKMSPGEIAALMGISLPLATKAFNLAYDFPHKLTGIETYKAFTGEAFKGLDVSTIPASVLDQNKDNWRVISSVYGILRPEDIIKPYRAEYNKAIAPGGKTPIQVFKSKNTVSLVNFIKANKVDDIIDLLPGDADKCVDWKIIRAFAKVNKVCFQIITPEGKLKTPLAKRLKELRGTMCREILTKGIKTFEELKDQESEHYVYSPGDSKPGLPVFITTA